MLKQNNNISPTLCFFSINKSIRLQNAQQQKQAWAQLKNNRLLVFSHHGKEKETNHSLSLSLSLSLSFYPFRILN